ncbi:response regulator transcription factor [Halorhodospira sp. 9621]|uniref:helix-turn-helix transcriptional regulator n=1 Tax=Halorhodospira sp. 9621 TaxID=2899135 RepID=UPI001EE94E47|nr:response regulator transcription factor [Halorhodospira sp. 9621]MCG5532443.1 response regulator transcription factor [Halorhodospira sp. 9621]
MTDEQASGQAGCGENQLGPLAASSACYAAAGGAPLRGDAPTHPARPAPGRSAGSAQLPSKRVALVGRADIQSRLLRELIEHSGVCRAELIEPASLDAAIAGGDRDLFLVPWRCLGEEQPSTSTWEAAGLAACSRVALLDVPLPEDVAPLLGCPGLVGVFTADTSPEILLRGVDAMLDGEIWLPRRALSAWIAAERCRPATAGVASGGVLDALTARERAVLHALAEGAPNKTIAHRLCVSVHTVKAQLNALYRKLRVANRVEAAIWACRWLDALPESRRPESDLLPFY